MITSLGPFPMTAVVLLLALALAAGVGWKVAQRGPEPRARVLSPLLDMLLVGVAAARVAFVLRWWPQYAAEPAGILRLGDGGYIAWVGVLTALGFGAWRARTTPALRKPLAWAAPAGLATWLLLGTALALLQASVLQLPTTPLAVHPAVPDASGVPRTQALASVAAGKPLVVNLWATWCPPCRREMPVLSRAQAARGDIAFAFVNQGESADEVAAFLRDTPLPLRNVLRDSASTLMREAGSRGLPTTLFFDANGRLVDTHMGELTEAGLARKLQRLSEW